MDQIKLRNSPEAKIQRDIINFLKVKDWTVMVTHGNMYQQGFPDLYILHHVHGAKWVEVKNPLAYSFTAAQRRYFPLISIVGGGIWIMTAATETEYKKLFSQPNWHTYMLK